MYYRAARSQLADPSESQSCRGSGARAGQAGTSVRRCRFSASGMHRGRGRERKIAAISRFTSGCWFRQGQRSLVTPPRFGRRRPPPVSLWLAKAHPVASYLAGPPAPVLAAGAHPGARSPSSSTPVAAAPASAEPPGGAKMRRTSSVKPCRPRLSARRGGNTRRDNQRVS